MNKPKLVRDLIPEIISQRNARPLTHIAGPDEYMESLRAKLQEEVGEFLADNNPEELADILEVVYALGDQLGVSRNDLEKLREKKATERGAFQKKLILDGVEEKLHS